MDAVITSLLKGWQAEHQADNASIPV